MKYKIKLTPHELTQNTVKDIENRRKSRKEGSKQAFMFCMENREKIKKRLRRRR